MSAPFNPLRGNSNNLPDKKTDGNVYFCKDNGQLFFDYLDPDTNTVNRQSVKSEQVQSDYTMNDSTDPSYIKNRLVL